MARRQHGAALIVGMLILAMVSAIAISAMTRSNLDLGMAANDESMQQALAIAENAAIEGEEDVRDNFSGPATWNWSDAPDPATDGRSADGYYDTGEITSVLAHNWDAEGDEGVELAASGGRYIVEFLGTARVGGGSQGMNSSNIRYVYRVTGRGTGAKGGERIVQSIFATSN